uniref:Uncharacterized protein n=1 Tax=Castor canadensis TaxID=51338 RepID=A0A8C0W8J6_CASCN
MMKLRLPIRNLLNPTNCNRIISSNTLHMRHHNSILFSQTYLPRCKLWLNYPVSPCQRSFHILYLPIHTCRMRNLLWTIFPPSAPKADILTIKLSPAFNFISPNPK